MDETVLYIKWVPAIFEFTKRLNRPCVIQIQWIEGTLQLYLLYTSVTVKLETYPNTQSSQAQIYINTGSPLTTPQINESDWVEYRAWIHRPTLSLIFAPSSAQMRKEKFELTKAFRKSHYFLLIYLVL